MLYSFLNGRYEYPFGNITTIVALYLMKASQGISHLMNGSHSVPCFGATNSDTGFKVLSITVKNG